MRLYLIIRERLGSVYQRNAATGTASKIGFTRGKSSYVWMPPNRFSLLMRAFLITGECKL
jgi:hypothetical protein